MSKLLSHLQKGRNKKNAVETADFITQEISLLPELLDYCFDPNGDYNQTACWVMSNILDRNPELLNPYLSRILEATTKEGYHDGVYRNCFRVLSRRKIPNDLHELAIDSAFTHFENKKNAVAIRAFSMKVLGDLLGKYPDVAQELVLMIEEELPHGTSGFKSIGKKVMRQLSNQ